MSRRYKTGGGGIAKFRRMTGPVRGRKKMKHTLLGLLAAAALTSTSAHAEDVCALPSARPDASVAALSWLAGNWIQTDKTNAVRERWAGPYGGVLLGIGVTTQGDATRSFEFFRIAKTPTGLSYFASPNGAPPTEFKAVDICADKVVFENKAHDFPQRVIYRKNADGTIGARIEGMLKGKLEGEEWRYRADR
jgi:hypothetical protein